MNARCQYCDKDLESIDYGLDVLLSPAGGLLQWVPCCTAARTQVESIGWHAVYGKTLNETLWDCLGYRGVLLNDAGAIQ